MSVKINRKACSCRYYLVWKVSSSSCVAVFVDDVLLPDGEPSGIVWLTPGQLP